MATIYIVEGPNNGEAYLLSEEEVVIGRGEESSIALADEKTSRSHLSVTYSHDSRKHVAKDLKSTNGTRCNGKLMSIATVLSDGDQLSFGDTVIEYSSASFESAAEAKEARSVGSRRGTNTLMDNQNAAW